MALLHVQNLSKRYGTNTAVNNISFDIPEGRCVALLGPNGAGKTTTLKMLAGLMQPTTGKIQFSNVNGGDIRQLIGYLPQYPSFYNWMSGKEFLLFVGRLAHVHKKELNKRCDEILDLVGLSQVKNRRIAGYSGGMKQRLGLAQALIHAPKLIILDEPVSALDPIGRREVLELMRTIKKEATILFSTHVLHDAEEISDDILIMRDGEIVIAGEMKQVIRNGQQPVIYFEGEDSLMEWAKGLLLLDYVEDVIPAGEGFKVFVKDMERNKVKLLRKIVDENIPIRKFEVANTTLEDLFMKVVGA